MANEDADRKTLLKIEGDAEGAKRAARETREAVRDVGETTEASGKKTQETTVRTSEDLDKQAKKTQDGAKGFDGLARGMGTSERAANAFREAVGRVSPALAGMLDIGIKSGDILNFTFSKLGLVFAGISGAIGVLLVGMHRIAAATREATAAIEGFRAANERLRAEARGQQREAATAAAQAGLPVEAIGSARQMIRELIRQGVERQAATAIAPYLVDEEGKRAVTDEQALLLAAAQQYGMIEPLSGTTERERRGHRRAAIRQVERPRARETIINAVETMMAEQLRDYEAMARGRAETELRDWIASRTGETGEELTKHTREVMRQMREGPRTGYITPRKLEFLPEDEPGDTGKKMLLGLIGAQKRTEELDPIIEVLKTQERQQREQLESFRRAVDNLSQPTRGEAQPDLTPIPPESERSHTREGHAEYEADEEGIRQIRPAPEPRSKPAPVSRPSAAAEPVPVYPGELNSEELAAREAREPEQAPAPSVPPPGRRSGPGGPHEGRLAAPEAPPARPELTPVPEAAPERPTKPEPPATTEPPVLSPTSTMPAPPPPPAPEGPLPVLSAPEPEDQAMLSAGGIGEPGTTVIFNHGNIHMGKDTRFKHVSRVENP